MDFDSVTFEDLFQFSPEPSHRGEEEGGSSRDYYIPSPQQQQHQQAQQQQSTAVEAEYAELQQQSQHQLTPLQNSTPYINYPQHQSLPTSNNWIEVPKVDGQHGRPGSSADDASTGGGLRVGSDGGSTLCVGSSGSTASLDDHFAATSIPGDGGEGGQPQPVRRRRGRGPADESYKLERSRQSARECRARKKLRYQYLDDIILERERANMVLRRELEKYVSWCTELDKGRLPDGWNDFITASGIKKEMKDEY